MASLEAVLSTEELLEEILQYVDMRTLLASCQRVNRFWRSTIKSSIPLQRALFLQPEASPGPPRRIRRMNPLLMTHFPFWFKGPDHPQDYLTKREKNGYYAFSSLSLFRASIRTADNPYLREDASWRCMLTAQPPVTVLGIMENSLHGMQFREHLSIRCYPVPKDPLPGSTAGLRMGEFYDMVLRHCATWEVSGFTVMQRIDQVPKDRLLHVADMPEALEAELVKLRDQEIQVLLQLFSTSGCFIGRVPREKYAFWNVGLLIEDDKLGSQLLKTPSVF
ncbi:hypothetical protein ESCO_001193 [Escovopsis weberi]|uniref:F-box domain-containing protein n=1 Tax=Escovopsis weberi TaxID=150374 RepID=A0A0M8MXL0_ESCWE|nr:hypothetical protein ESCO_001193 [Escovopsis weberi]